MITYLRTHKILSLVILAILAVALYFYFTKDAESYEVYRVSRTTMQDTLELSGQVQADSMATLRFSAGGLLTYLGARPGDSVQKWQTLASIDTRQLQKTLDQKLNLYAIQRGTFEQTKDDNDNSVPDGELGLTLKRLLEKNQYQLDNTVKDVEYLDLSLKLSRLTSPLAGILVKSPVDTTGVQVLPTDTWVVIDPTSLYFSADLDETDLSRVFVGQKVIITLDAYPDKSFTSSIHSIAYTPKETTVGTTYELKLLLASSDILDLRLGLNGTASIILLEKENVLSVPSLTIKTTGNESTVLTKSGNKYQSQIVETGIENNGQVEILNGLAESDLVYVQN